MSEKERMAEWIEPFTGGMVTTSQAPEQGFHRSVLQQLVSKGELYRYAEGIYLKKDAWEDEIYLLQLKYKRGVYSHETALYLLGYSDRTPSTLTMTFPKGYNAPSIKRENLVLVRVVLDNYSFGITTIDSPCSHPIQVYEIERTLCDLLRGNKSDIALVNEAMKRYLSSSDRNIPKLLDYAERLHVKGKVLRYLEVLL